MFLIFVDVRRLVSLIIGVIKIMLFFIYNVRDILIIIVYLYCWGYLNYFI